MALTPNTDQAFLREVDEELRRDQLAGFWTRYGRATIAAVLIALAAFGGFLFWQHRQGVAAGEEGEKLQTAYDALASDRVPQAAAPLADLAGSSREGYRAIALFTQADVLLRKQDTKGAAAKFAAVAGDADQPAAFRELALIRQTSAEYDTLAPQVVIDRMRPLAVPANAYFGSAGELLAVAYIRTGRRDLAGRLFGQIAANAQVPDTIRQRAVQMAGSLGVDAGIQQGSGSR
ncbi:MAG TPA: tetratricopeptide repeat protein [Sphingomonas sp.]